jgi:hypothetical protein
LGNHIDPFLAKLINLYGILIWYFGVEDHVKSPIGIGILRIVRSSQESIFDMLMSKWVFMKKYYKNGDQK